jgi:hypothetical protein
MHGAHDIGGEGADGVALAGGDERLGGQVDHDLGVARGDGAGDRYFLRYVGDAMVEGYLRRQQGE